MRDERVWEATGSDGHRYAFVIMTNSWGERALGLVLRDAAPYYWRLHRNYSAAVHDGDEWAREIRQKLGTTVLVATGGLDRHRRTWSLRVIQRPRRWEVHVTYGGFIPSVREFTNQEDAELTADEWLTDFYEGEDVARSPQQPAATR